MMSDDPVLAHELSQECMNLLEQGAVPPLPITSFPYRDYAQALRLMTTGQHTGKLVLQAPSTSDTDSLPITDLRPFLDPDATYLVTGGMGGFGRLLLPYLVSAGARHLTLLDRDPERRRRVDWVRNTSALRYLSVVGRDKDRYRPGRRRRRDGRTALCRRATTKAEGRFSSRGHIGRLPVGRPDERVAG